MHDNCSVGCRLRSHAVHIEAKSKRAEAKAVVAASNALILKRARCGPKPGQHGSNVIWFAIGKKHNVYVCGMYIERRLLKSEVIGCNKVCGASGAEALDHAVRLLLASCCHMGLSQLNKGR
jgi:hypothetical protein